MKESRDKIERIKRKVEDLIELVLVKATNYEHHPQFPKADKFRGASKHLQKASHALFMAGVCLMPEDKDA
jgi:hypothetical protein